MIEYLTYLHVPDQSLWVVCLAIYAFDNIKRLEPTNFILFKSDGAWRPLLPMLPLQPANRVLAVLPLLAPWAPAVRMPWPQGGDGEGASGSLARLATIEGLLLPFRLVSGVLLVTIFIAGPALTHVRSLETALTWIAPVYGLAVVTASVFLLLWRKDLNFSVPKAVLTSIECALIPGYMVNICRRVSLGYGSVAGDAISVIANAAERQGTAWRPQLDAYLDELLESGLVSEADTRSARPSADPAG